MKLNLAIALALVASFVSAQSHRNESKHSTVVFVIATNPAFPGGVFVAPDLATAKIEAKQMTSLDPVCNSVPQVCEARANMTVYTVIYSDGTKQVL